MKTTAQHLIVIAIIALFGINVNAQNTKSIRVHHLDGKFASYVSERVHFVKNELSADLKSLEAYIKFKPSEINSEAFVSEPLTELASIAAQMEIDVRYTPSVPNYNSFNVESFDFSKVTRELEKTVKFKPSENVEENNPEFSAILKELENDVRYQPSMAI